MQRDEMATHRLNHQNFIYDSKVLQRDSNFLLWNIISKDIMFYFPKTDSRVFPLHEKLLEAETIVQNMESIKEEANTMEKLKETKKILLLVYKTISMYCN